MADSGRHWEPGDKLATNLPIATGKGLTNADGTASILAGAGGFSITGTLAVSGVQNFANGTAAAPSIAFTNSTGTGFYRVASNTLGLAIAGVAGLAIAGSSPTFAAADDVAGADVYLKVADGGANATTARAGANFNFIGGAGSGTNSRGGGFNFTLGAANGTGVPGFPMFKGAIGQIVQSLTTSLANATVTNGGTISAAQHRGAVVYQDASGGSVTMTTGTAAQLVADFPGVQVGSAFKLYVASNHATHTSTLSGGTGVTITGAATVTQAGGQFLGIFTNVTASSEAVALLRVG